MLPLTVDISRNIITLFLQNGLRRMDSTKRIKKQLRQKRSSFLGIEGYDDDSYLEPGKKNFDFVKVPSCGS